jgi:5-methylcytosine-specific restriction endonuclease McrA
MALNGRVLLLNQTYEPLGTVSVARAVIMTFKNTVTVEELEGNRVLRSAHAEFPVPSVIRRRTYINVRRRREAAGAKRLRIYMRDKFRCQYCGEKKGAGQLTLDHILPRSRGGDNSPVNIVTACVPCNNRKSNRTPDEARMPLNKIHDEAHRREHLMTDEQLDEMGGVMMKDETTCIRCAMCASRCPTHAILMKRFDFSRACVSVQTRNPKVKYG